MYPRREYLGRITPMRVTLFATLCLLMVSFGWPATVQAAPVSQTIVSTTTITEPISAAEDIGVLESDPDFNAPRQPYFVLNSRPNGGFDHNFIRFDLSFLPAAAIIVHAYVEVYVEAAPENSPLLIQFGHVEGDWDAEALTWSTQPTVTWRAGGQTATGVGPIAWPAKSLLESWLDGSRTNYGMAIRGQTPNTGGTRATTIEGATDDDDDECNEDKFPPRLVVTYRVPNDSNPRTDLGDAPDSTNHHGMDNTAYVAGNILGHFPTVWDGSTNQPAGPRHVNQTVEGFLGQYISREDEADQGTDLDGPNNILQTIVPGVTADIANNDDGDDGWRNRNIGFPNCSEQTLTVRITKAPTATLETMVLNVWFDGNRDGDWADSDSCSAILGFPQNKMSYEWIVQDHIVDMTAIPAGGFVDLPINTERILNNTPLDRHWMRFTLSEEPAVQPVSGELPDGRGPHPNGALDSFEHGETEDVLQKPPSPREDGE